MPRLIKFQVALLDHIFDDLIRLGHTHHRTFRQQATHYLEEAVKQAIRNEEHALAVAGESDHDAAE